MKTVVREMHADLNGNGQPGIKDFVAGTKAQLRLLAWLCATIIALLGIFIALEANHQAKSGELNLSETPTMAVSR